MLDKYRSGAAALSRQDNSCQNICNDPFRLGRGDIKPRRVKIIEFLSQGIGNGFIMVFSEIYTTRKQEPGHCDFEVRFTPQNIFMLEYNFNSSSSTESHIPRAHKENFEENIVPI